MSYEFSLGSRILGYIVGFISLILSEVFMLYLLWGK